MAKSTPSLNDLLAQRAALEKQIAGYQSQQRAETIAKIKALMADYGLTAADLGGAKLGRPAQKAAAPAPAAGASSAPASTPSSSAKGKRKSANAGKKVAPKFRNPATGDTWSGRGLKPKWLSAALSSGRALSDFAI